MQHFSPAQLRARRERAGLSREQVATAISRSWPSIYGYERGGNVPTTEVLERLADVLGCAVGDFFEAPAAVLAGTA